MEDKNGLELDVRRRIHDIIFKSPGIHFRELQRQTKLVIGSLQYHLNYMVKKGIIAEHKSGDYSRFYVEGELTELEKKIMSALRQKNMRKLVIYLLQKNKPANHKEITCELKLSPSTVSWYLSRLVQFGILKQKKKGRETYFSVAESDKVIRVLIKYRESFLDKIVDKFIDAWNES